MKINKSILTAVLVFPLMLLAQEKNDTIVAPKVKLERAAFESTSLIESQTNVLYTKGTLEMVMNHRFGLVNSGPGANDMIGIWAPANIRIGVNYSITDYITVGLGTTKDNRLQDLNYKFGLLRQTRSNKMPVSVSYYGNVACDARPTSLFLNFSDRFSYYNQLIIARRFNANFSFQVAPSFSHINYAERPIKSDILAVEMGGRVKINPTTSVLVDYNLPITTYEGNRTKPGMALGVEFSTGSHAFQIFITNYKSIIPQENVFLNQNNFLNGKFMIGFNITRLWHM
jgi:hypothetical protein